MDQVQQIPTQNLIQFNKCRIYLKAITMSDIADTSGLNIKQHITQQHPNKSKIIWPTEQRTGEHMWNTWNWAINKFILNSQHKLKTPLGKWIITPSHVIPERAISSDKQCIYIKMSNEWNKHMRRNQI